MTYVDCDSHILPEDAFADVPAAFRQEGPRIETDAKDAPAWFIRRASETFPITRALSPIRLTQDRARPATSRKFVSPIWRKPRSIFKCSCRAMALFITMSEPELGAAVCRSYNNAIGRIVKKHPGKFLGLATLPMQAPQLAADELDRAVRQLGLQGVVCYTTVGDKDLDGEEFWPFYAKAEELAIPIIFHPVNTGPIVGGWRMTRHYATRGYGFWSALGNSMENSITIANLMFGGVLDAFPKLRFCFLEGGGTQVPHLMEGLAAVYSGEGDYDRLLSKPKREPHRISRPLVFLGAHQ